MFILWLCFIDSQLDFVTLLVIDFIGLWQKFSRTARFKALCNAKIRSPLFGSQFGQLECVVSLSGNSYKIELEGNRGWDVICVFFSLWILGFISRCIWSISTHKNPSSLCWDLLNKYYFLVIFVTRNFS